MKTIILEVKPSRKQKTKEALFVKVPFDLELLARIKRMPTRHYSILHGSWEIPLRHLKDVVSLFQDQKLAADDRAKKLMGNVAQFDSVESSSFQYKTKPFDHQVEGFEYGMEHYKFLLGDEQGLGKTKQAIDIATARSHQFKHCLIVCGVNSVKFNWLNEVHVHSHKKAHVLGTHLASKGPRAGTYIEGDMISKDILQDLKKGLDAYFLIVNVESLRNKQIASELQKMCEKGTIGMVVIDEIHKCKNPTSQQGKAIHCLRSYYRMALTGTPLVNSPIDMYNILKWLDIEKSTFTQFKSRYCVFGGFGNTEVVGYQNMPELRKKVAGIMLRRRKSEVLDLPPKIRSVDYVELTPKQRQIYKEVLIGIQRDIDKLVLVPNPLAELTRLRQATGHTGILSTTVNESAKFNRLEEILEELVANDQKAIIFSNWTQIIDRVMEQFKKYKPATITGAVKDREEMVRRFQKDSSCKFIAGTFGAMGTGLNLTAASTVILLDKPWTQAETEQAEDRAHRIGTTGTVNIITLVARGTVDERIEQLVFQKGEIADALVDGNMHKLDKRQLFLKLIS